VANAIWGEKTYPFSKPYLDSLTAFYDTGALRQADFRNAPDKERVRINNWTETQTVKRIKNLLPAGAVNALTRLVLVNAIYFKSEWLTPFDEQRTRDEDFTRIDGSRIKTPIMREYRLETVRYAAFNGDGSLFRTPDTIRHGRKTQTYPGENGLTMIELPYRGSTLTMVIIAPNKPDGIATVENLLTLKRLTEWIAQLKQRTTHVFLPRFRGETSYRLDETLQSMGLTSAFKSPLEQNGADFSGMTTSADPMDRLYIGLVQHKAFIDVNEKGTEAAAATVVAMEAGCAEPEEVPFVPTFRADRPFLYLIRDRQTGCILFLGRVMSP